ncbi:MAG TPA: HlyD family efflux transporter periplasmic adaptor subunit [Candidatus Acidoferrum sp.]|nr:HlyD family efflux transporter periplasmic adaptor subunit [Candidatus Acidoferrum sp.]
MIDISILTDEKFDDIKKQPGDKVTKGEILGSLDSRRAALDLAQAKAEARQAEAQVAALKRRMVSAQQSADRTREAANAGAVEQQQADEAEQALSQLRAELAAATAGLDLVAIHRQQAELELAQRTVRAPADGELIKVYAQQGARVGGNNNSVAFVLLPAKPMQVRAEVNEGFIGRLHTGAKASISLESAPEAKPLAAHVVRLGKLVESSAGSDAQPAGRIVEAILEFDQPQNVLVGQNVMVRFYE